jgi:type I restriction enzyme, S subunit
MAMLPQFLSYQMMSPYFELQFNQAGTGSTVKHLPLPSCQSFEVRVPSIEMQERFEASISSTRAKEVIVRKGISQLQALFASLQHRAFRGEL